MGVFYLPKFIDNAIEKCIPGTRPVAYAGDEGFRRTEGWQETDGTWKYRDTTVTVRYSTFRRLWIIASDGKELTNGAVKSAEKAIKVATAVAQRQIATRK